MEELADLLNGENQLVEALPKMVEASQSLTLKFVLRAHLEVAIGHAERLQDIISNIGQVSQRLKNKTMKGLIEESEEVINHTVKCQDRDSTIINVVKLVECYEIVVYQTACEHAADLGHTRIVELLNRTLKEEREMSLHLNELALGMDNARDINAQGHRQ